MSRYFVIFLLVVLFVLVLVFSAWVFFSALLSDMFVALFEPRPVARRVVAVDGFTPLDPEAMELIRSEYDL